MDKLNKSNISFNYGKFAIIDSKGIKQNGKNNSTKQ
jgi:hypothetical protein